MLRGNKKRKAIGNTQLTQHQLSKPKVAFVIQSLELGGAQKVVAQLVNSRELQEAFDIHLVLFINHIAFPVLSPVKIHVRFFHKSTNIFYRLVTGVRKVFYLRRLCREEGFDCVVSHMRTSNIQLLMACLKRPTIVVEHNVPTQKFSIKFPFNPLCGLLYRRATAAVFVSVELHDMWKRIKLPRLQRMIYDPLDVAESTRQQGERRKVAAPDRFILGVGRLVKAKGFDMLIDCFGLINDPGLHLLIIGDGEERDRLQQHAMRSSKSHLITFIHDEHDPLPYMRSSECFVLSSRWEGLAVVLLEALACKCRIVSFDCSCGPKEILAGGLYGKLVKTGDAAGLAKAIEESLANPVSYTEQEWHEQLSKFDSSKISGEYASLIAEVLEMS